MRFLSFGFTCLLLIVVELGGIPVARAEDPLAMVRKAAAKSTLDQNGTHPFHLHATVTPSPGRDANSGRTGDIEIWWQAPGVYRRELRATGFNQIEIVSGGHVWQSNEGDYLPQWLDEVARAILDPLPPQSAAMKGVAPNIVKASFGSIYANWELPLPMDQQPSKEVVALKQDGGLLYYDMGLGWGGFYNYYASFHGREVPRTFTIGSPEVTAKVVLLEDLPHVPPNWFDASTPGGDPHPIRFVAIDHTDLATDLAEGSPMPDWPPVTNTPTEGVIWTDLVLDRTGRIREPFSPISDNPAINEAAKTYFAGLRFKPVLQDGQPVQVVRHVVLRFHLKRPAGVEDLGTSGEAFERGRAASTLAVTSTAPYVLRAKISAHVGAGVMQGTYTDIWQDAAHWRRESVVGDSRAVRSLDGKQQYLLTEGPQAQIARLVLSVVEPIPAQDTFTESDWSLQRDNIGVPTVLVLRGRKGPGDVLDPAQRTGYWFDASGRLVQAYTAHLALSYSEYQAFHGGQFPKVILGRIKPDAGAALRLDLSDPEVLDPATLKKDSFRVSGHEWDRKFTAETR